jgi:hypothetical protein
MKAHRAGLIAGVIAAVALRQFLFSDLPMAHVIVVSILVGVFGQLGDLAESILNAHKHQDASELEIILKAEAWLGIS